MYIVHLLDYFHPNAGYQTNILAKNLQKKGHKNLIITPKVNKYNEYLNIFFGHENIDQLDIEFKKLYGVEIFRVDIHKYFSSRAIYKNSIFKLIDNLAPDLLYVYDIDSYSGIRFVLRTKKTSYPVIFNSTMLEMASRNRFAKFFRFFYKIFVTPKIIQNKLHIIRTQNDEYINKAFKIPLDQSTFISFGSDTSIFYPDRNFKYAFREKFQIKENEVLFIYAGKLDQAKGVELLAKAFTDKIISNKGYEAVLILVGNFMDNEKNLERQFNNCNSKILRFDTVPYLELPYYYKSVDFSIFPKQVSLSFFDVQASGLPVILEENDINISRTSYHNGLTYNSDNFLDLIDKIKLMLEYYSKDYLSISENAAKMIRLNYSWELITEDYIKVFKEYVNEFHKGR